MQYFLSSRVLWRLLFIAYVVVEAFVLPNQQVGTSLNPPDVGLVVDETAKNSTAPDELSETLPLPPNYSFRIQLSRDRQPNTEVFSRLSVKMAAMWTMYKISTAGRNPTRKEISAYGWASHEPQAPLPTRLVLGSPGPVLLEEWILWTCELVVQRLDQKFDDMVPWLNIYFSPDGPVPGGKTGAVGDLELTKAQKRNLPPEPVIPNIVIDEDPTKIRRPIDPQKAFLAAIKLFKRVALEGDKTEFLPSQFVFTISDLRIAFIKRPIIGFVTTWQEMAQAMMATLQSMAKAAGGFRETTAFVEIIPGESIATLSVTWTDADIAAIL